MSLVNECPTNVTETAAASKRLECVNDKYGNNQYICVPNEEKTSLVEFCYDGIMGIQEKGICLEVNGKILTTHSCLNFSSGCPKDTFWNYEFYKYPECQNINSQHGCYTMDPSCPVSMNGNETTSSSVFIYIIIPAAILCLALIALGLVAIFRHKLKKEKGAGARLNTEMERKLTDKTRYDAETESYMHRSVPLKPISSEASVESYYLYKKDANLLEDIDEIPEYM